jgi:HD-like signal output (HDOD) protein
MTESDYNISIEEKRKETEKILDHIYNLPANSRVMMEVTGILDDPSINNSRLAQWISKDQSLTAKILSIANSPLYGLPRKVSTIEFAILIIGFHEIKNIVLALLMIESFKNGDDENFNKQEFWKHSIITGNASKRIADDLGYRFEAEAFVAGLLHDMAVPVIHKHFSEEFFQIIEIVNSDPQKNFIEAETEVLGMNHQEVADFLADKWNLPDNFRAAIRNHHNPGKASKYKELAAVVHLGDYLTQKHHLADFQWDEEDSLDYEILDILGFDDEDMLEKFMVQYQELFFLEFKTLKV